MMEPWSRAVPLVLLALPACVSAALCSTLPPVGRAIELASSADQLLAAANRIDPPGPPFAKPHLSQDVHQLKRQQTASNALTRLGKLLIGSGTKCERHSAMRDERLPHLVSCAAEPSCARADGDDAALDEQSARAVARSLESLATLCAADAADCAGADRQSLWPLHAGALKLASRAEALSDALRLPEAVSCRWAARRLLGTSLPTPKLDELSSRYPFDMYPGVVALPLPAAAPSVDDMSSISLPSSSSSMPMPSMAALMPQLSVEALRDGIPFAQAELLTADGRRVRERRQTAWLAEEGIGALAYSGKLMNPSPMEACDAVRRLRDALEADLGERFDCALCNLYAEGGKAACAWHRDPEHGDEIDGAKWARPTYVVSAGETRRFAFRPYRGDKTAAGATGAGDGGEDDRHVVALFAGDVIAMDGECNEDYEHSVLSGQGRENEAARVSIVFKRALVSRDGKRGHTLEGQGRRARARAARGGGEAEVNLSARDRDLGSRGGGRGAKAGRGGLRAKKGVPGGRGGAGRGGRARRSTARPKTDLRRR